MKDKPQQITDHTAGLAAGGYDEYQRMIGYDVEDSAGEKVGTLHNLWVDETTGEPELVGVKTGWLLGRNHVVPAESVQANHSRRTVRLPYTEEKVKGAPTFDADAEISDRETTEIRSYYEVRSTARSNPAPTPTPAPAPSSLRQERMEANAGSVGAAGDAKIRLHEEQVKVGKREVEAGGIRLRKIVRTETINQPVELKREDVIIERVPGQGSAEGASFKDEDIYIPLRREEPVVEKRATVREEVRVGKKSETERTNVSETVRSEDIEIERKDERRPL